MYILLIFSEISTCVKTYNNVCKINCTAFRPNSCALVTSTWMDYLYYEASLGKVSQKL